MSPKATDEGCSRERQRLTPLEHPSSVSALRADPPSPTGGEGKSFPTHSRSARLPRTPARRPAPPGRRRARTASACSGSG
ncbi:MAG: hypothetical protein E5X48_30410 [Mesorhizobium sp.]|nr:MAG: hypothetical protein E5X48_30410 [Mesorhizobium sp.]